MFMFYCCVLFLFYVYFVDVSNVLYVVLVDFSFSDVAKLSADTSVFVLMLCLIPFQCLFYYVSTF